MTEKKIRLPIEQIVPVLQLQLEQGGKAPLQVTGSSMHPMLQNHRDAVLLEQVTRPLQKGDIIFYRRESGAYVLHRIVKLLDTEHYICSGDNQWQPEAVSADQVIAVVAAFKRKGKQYSVEHAGYRRYVGLWTALFPVRRPILSARRLLGRIKYKLNMGE